MDLDKMLRHVNNLNDYISVTQEVAKNAYNNSKIQFNMSTVLLLKKVRSLEIEYFNKCEGNGAALVLFERMVEQPSSKTWGLLGKELVLLLQYWLDAIRKHLIRHSHHWWAFLKLLLKFIRIIRTKDHSLPDILVEGTTECLLDLATSSEPDLLQKHEILCCLNLYCAESSREIRFALRNKFESYFTKLASLVTSCGHLPSQYSALEALLRWLLPRQAPRVRRAAADKWFPEDRCGRRALDLFLERPWQDFFQDARDFLNACNEATDLVTSVVCRNITLGDVVIVQGTEKRETWLDVNCSDMSVSVVLDPRFLDALGVKEVMTWETLVVPKEDVTSVQLLREASEAKLVICSSAAARLRARGARVRGRGALVAGLRAAAPALRRLDRALRRAFPTNYQVLLDLDAVITPSPQENNSFSKKIQSSEDDTRFSHPVEIHRRKHSGFIVRARKPVAWQSPSTASTTSLAQLHEKLESLPQYKFDKEAVHVCALPELSTVTEVSETDDRQSLLSSQAIKIHRHYGVCQKSSKVSDRNSQSDGEVQNKAKVGRYLSPVEKDHEISNNCLLVATIGSADESVINDTLERLTKNKDYRSDNIVDLLVQEALQKDFNDRELLDSGINTGDNTKKTQNVNEGNSEAIENTPLERLNVETAAANKEHEKSCTVISNTTTDESNDVVCETPKNFVTFRRRTAKKSIKENVILDESNEKQVFDVNAVEQFFSQHIAEYNRGEIVISPTLARKINETSSESEQFEDCLIMNEDNNVNVDQIELQDIEIVECLNSMVDKVCSDFEKCTEFLNQDTMEMNEIEVNNALIENPPDVIPLTDVSNMQNVVPEKEDPKSTETTTNKPIKLKYTAKKNVKTAKSRATTKKKNTKIELVSASAISPTKEKGSDDTYTNATTPETTNKDILKSPKTDSPTSKSVDLTTPLIRRKRKLYSPKYENIDREKADDNTKDDFKVAKIYTPKYKSTCYKDIEADRKKRIRQPRTRISRAKSDTPSPRTKKRNDVFDQLKEKLECPVTVVPTDKRTEKDLAIYNFTSDSEDEDFKKKKIEVQKRISSTTIASGDSSMSTRKGRTVNRVNYSENKSSDETVKKSTTRQKRTVRRKRTPRTRLVKPGNELIDEKMRKAESNELNTSIIAAKHSGNTCEEPQLMLTVNPEMEVIPDDVIEVTEDKRHKKPTKKQKKAEVLSLKKEKNANLNTLNVEQDNDDRTISPLPGLVIEAIPSKEEDANDSVSANMIEKLKKIQQGGPEEFINETNTTQNLLSDVERMNYSPIQMNITDEFNKFVNENSINDNNDTRSSTKSLKTSKVKDLDKATILRMKKEVSDDKKRKHQNKTPVTINLSDTKSEKSIATVGKSPITAHGDSDEAPPHSELLAENLKPRDLEIEYLDQSIKDYFNKLRSEVDEIPTDRKESNESVCTKVMQKSKREISKEKSPVVSIKRLSFDDISKWLPSPRHSDTESRRSVDSDNFTKVTKIITTKTNEPLPKDSSEDELLAIQFNNSSLRRSERYKTKPEIIEYNNNKNNSANNANYHSPCSIWLRSRGAVDLEIISKNVNDLSKDLNKSFALNTSTVKKAKNKTKADEKPANRKSMISPIRFFDEACSNEKEKSPILRQRSTTRQVSSVSRERSTSVQQKSIIDEHQSSSDEEHYVETSKISSNKKLKLVTKDTSLVKAKNFDTIREQIKTQTRIDSEVSGRKRKSKSPDIGFPKRRRAEDIVTISESGPSMSSVNEWFRRNGPVSRAAESTDTSLRDNIQSIMEKLDTTLAEIHQNTSKKFIDLFVGAQGRLAEMRRDRRAMLKAAAAQVLAQVVSAIDERFADLDRRSQEMHNDFAEQLKAQASKLIREDCRKKQVMVSLLREDLGATLARIDQQRGGAS